MVEPQRHSELTLDVIFQIKFFDSKCGLSMRVEETSLSKFELRCWYYNFLFQLRDRVVELFRILNSHVTLWLLDLKNENRVAF